MKTARIFFTVLYREVNRLAVIDDDVKSLKLGAVLSLSCVREARSESSHEQDKNPLTCCDYTLPFFPYFSC